MRVVVPQITWHSRDPVLSVDFDPSCKIENGYYRVASGGGDCQLLVWRLSAPDTLKPELTCVAELKRHEKPVNVVRFSPDGEYIASGGDDAYIILWKRGEITEKEETWIFEKSLRKHIEDVSDLSWSPDGNFLVSASIDNSAVYWDVKKGAATHVWSEKEHTGFVHGVSLDPLHEFAATICIDRNLRLFDLKNYKLAHKALKYPDTWVTHEIKEDLETEKENLPGEKPNLEDSLNLDGTVKKKAAPIVNRLFQDEFLQTFCRRLSFSPKGELLLVPGGMLPPGQNVSDAKIKDDQDKKPSADDETEKKGKDKIVKKKAASNNNAVIVFCRHSWTNPCAVIPTLDSYSIGGRFCPIYFQNKRTPFRYDDEDFVNLKKNERTYACVGKIAPQKEEKFPLMKMPYRLVFAVATNDSVFIWDTISSEPLAVIRSIHLARITDITWATDGRALMVSSTDGYCSIITFSKGELGDEYETENFPVLTKDCFPILPPEPKIEKVKKNKTPKAKLSEGKVQLAEGTPAAGGSKETDATKVKKKKAPTGDKKSTKAKNSPFPTPRPNSLNEKLTGFLVEKKTDSKLLTEPFVEEDTENKHTPAEEGTPKAKTPCQKTTLDRWFTKAPKSATTPDKKMTPIKPNQSSTPVSTPPTNQPTNKVPKVIVIDDESDDSSGSLLADKANAEASTQPLRIYPMTPPAKPITVRRLATSSTSMSPLATSNVCSGESGSKKRPGDVTPEEVFKLTTAPIKCRRLHEEPEILMQSWEKSIELDIVYDGENVTTNIAQKQKSTSPTATPIIQKLSDETAKIDDIASPKVTDPNCPPSPVSGLGSGSRAPRRITLTTLTKSPTNSGNLD